MRSRKVLAILLTAVLTLQSAPAALAAEETDETVPETGETVLEPDKAVPDETPTSETAVLELNSYQHTAFMDGSSDGLFHPQDSILRSEAAKIVYSLLIDPPRETAAYPDLSTDAWYAVPVGVLGALDLLHTDENGMIRPAEAITRAEFADIVCVFLPEITGGPVFSDVPETYWAYSSVMTAAACGIFGGYEDSTFRPDGALTRAEAAAAVGRLLGRSADLSALSDAEDIVSIFPDVPADFWAYGPVMEAAVAHTHAFDPNGAEYWTHTEPRHTVLEDGFHTINSRLYRVKDGLFLHSVTVDGFTYDANGRYTTGSDYLDQRLPEIVSKYTGSSMTRDQKLRALYNYVRDNYRYLKRRLIDKGETGWENEAAEDFLKTGAGNCFSYAALYSLLVHQLGIPAYTVVGNLYISIVQDHGWVEIPLDGKTYLFDAELEWSYLNRHNKKIDLFMVDPDHAPYTYIR